MEVSTRICAFIVTTKQQLKIQFNFNIVAEIIMTGTCILTAAI